MKRILKRLVLLTTALLWSGLVPAGDLLTVEDAWIREAPPGVSALAGYMTLHNHSDEARILVDASCIAFASVMLHRTVMEGEMAKMIHQKRITIPAGESLTFKPSDYHLMLVKPKHPIKAGDKVDITLSFLNAENITVTHEVRGNTDGAMDDMDHSQMHH